jgi:hypothetical protein
MTRAAAVGKPRRASSYRCSAEVRHDEDFEASDRGLRGAPMSRIPLGDLLITARMLQAEQLEHALAGTR